MCACPTTASCGKPRSVQHTNTLQPLLLMQPLLLLPYCYRLQDLKPSDMQGLVVILFGLLLYRFCAPLVALLKRLHRHWSGEGPDVEEEEAGAFHTTAATAAATLLTVSVHTMSVVLVYHTAAGGADQL
eukprot:5105-Heterococcus_DN1.PRE.5